MREHRSQPRRQTTAALVVAEERLSLTVTYAKSVEFGEESVCEIDGCATWRHRLSGATQHRAILAHESIPGDLVTGLTRSGEVEVFFVRTCGSRAHAAIVYYLCPG